MSEIDHLDDDAEDVRCDNMHVHMYVCKLLIKLKMHVFNNIIIDSFNVHLFNFNAITHTHSFFLILIYLVN